MKKSGIISFIALLVALTGLLIALAAYFKKKNCLVCDDFDDEMMDDDSEYFAAQYDLGPDEGQIHPSHSSSFDDPAQAEEDEDPSI